MEINKFLNLVSEVLGVSADSLSLDTSRKELEEWDSLNHIRLIVEAEETYRISIPIEKIADIEKLAEIYAYVNKEVN